MNHCFWGQVCFANSITENPVAPQHWSYRGERWREIRNVVEIQPNEGNQQREISLCVHLLSFAQRTETHKVTIRVLCASWHDSYIQKWVRVRAYRIVDEGESDSNDWVSSAGHIQSVYAAVELHKAQSNLNKKPKHNNSIINVGIYWFMIWFLTIFHPVFVSPSPPLSFPSYLIPVGISEHSENDDSDRQNGQKGGELKGEEEVNW